MKVINLFIISYMLLSNSSYAQINNKLLEDQIELTDSTDESICLSVYNNTFFKNNEYFDQIASGYTLFGTQLKTQLAYIINKNVRIQAGIYARKDFGNEQFSKIAPLVSIKLQNNGYNVIMGSLEGNVSHQLSEPIYNYERVILDHVENGLQFKVEKRKLWADTWINWEVQQYLNSNYQEQLSGGHSSKILIFEDAKGLKVQLPCQILISHKGGQLDLDTSSLKTLANFATGFELKYTNKNKNAFIQSVSSQNYITYFKDMSPNKTLNFKEGTGLYFNVNMTSKYDIGLSYGFWSGKNYLSSRGGDLFQSEASIYGKKGYIEPKRDLLFFRLLYQRRVFDALNVDVRFEPFYDMNNNYFAYSYSVYFVYKSDLTLKHLKKRLK